LLIFTSSVIDAVQMRKAAAVAAISAWLTACASLSGLSADAVDAGGDGALAPDARGSDAEVHDAADADEDAIDASSEPDVAPVPRTVFVTSQTWIGNFGGPTAADGLCNTAANGKLTGTFHAWLSDGASDARDHVTGAGPWYLPSVDGGARALVAPDKKTLEQGALLHPINVDEAGRTAFTSAWTGTDGTGLRTGVSCNNWSSGSGAMSGTSGVSNATDGKWSNNIGIGCVSLASLYCFEQ
jgi:hypothetical protein